MTTEDTKSREYIRPMPSNWWLKRKSYFMFMVRELTCLFVGGYALFLLILASRLGAAEDFSVLLKNPLWIVFQLSLSILKVKHFRQRVYPPFLPRRCKYQRSWFLKKTITYTIPKERNRRSTSEPKTIALSKIMCAWCQIQSKRHCDGCESCVSHHGSRESQEEKDYPRSPLSKFPMFHTFPITFRRSLC